MAMTQQVDTIWREFSSELKTFIAKKVGNTTDADDILQDAFIKVMTNINKVEAAGNMRSYLYAIVKNSIVDYFRKLKKDRLKEPIGNFQFSTEEEEDLNETISICCITPFITLLPEPYKEALFLTEVEKISQKELAVRLNISYSGAKSRVQRGKVKLKNIIAECLEITDENEKTELSLKACNADGTIQLNAENCKC